MTLYRRRAQVVEAVQYTGQEQGELLRLLGYVPILLTVGWWCFKDGRCLPDREFRAEFEPVPAEESGWVAVSERLPEKRGDYWCFDAEGMVTSNRDLRFKVAAFFPDLEGETRGMFDSAVTHWRPLPPAPKETSNG